MAHVCAHAHVHTRVHARIHARMHARMHARTHAHMHAHTHAHTHARTHTRVTPAAHAASAACTPSSTSSCRTQRSIGALRSRKHAAARANFSISQHLPSNRAAKSARFVLRTIFFTSRLKLSSSYVEHIAGFPALTDWAAQWMLI